MARPDLDWQLVESSNLAEVAWESTEPGERAQYGSLGTLHIVFDPKKGKRPRHYTYANVPYEVYRGLLSAPSKGTYHAENIKWKYVYTEL